MSALAVEAITLEGAGLPVAAFAVDTLARSIGRSMARLHGFPDYPFIEIPAPYLESVLVSDAEFERKTVAAVAQAEDLLLRDTNGRRG